ncbi:MAG: four helix bundle protein [Verrucomicrobiota bacterium]
MNSPKSFEDLDAWKAARALTNEVHAYCRREPLCRDFGLCDQLRRAAVSAMNNIAEGWESHHVAAKLQFDNFARRSCGEVRSMSYVLLDHQFVSAAEHTALRDRCIRTGQLIRGLIRSLTDRS